MEIRESPLLSAVINSAALRLDKVFGKIFRDERIESFYTQRNGFPIPDKKPENTDEDLWNYMSEYVISHSELRKRVEGHSQLFFIGGVFERCLGNAAAYCADRYKIPGENIFCVKDLCVSFDKGEAKLMENELLKRKVHIINSKDIQI